MDMLIGFIAGLLVAFGVYLSVDIWRTDISEAVKRDEERGR